uniref:Uncharacterized protein n=1 Tax=Tanacetum cinerariifolium TaxID=118510 RepID=A0A6L2L364_TANCI|nr:hypothetical protein [Tanacetum cinerariifolium]
MGDDVDINTLTMEQYLALIQYNIRPSIIKLEIDGLDILTHIRLDSKGFIPLMSPAQALKSIQVMADHSHKWYDEATTRESINDSSNNIGTKKLKENIHAIQVSHKICEGAHPTNDYPLVKRTRLQSRAIHPKKQKDNPYKTRETVGILEKILTKKAQEDEGDMDECWDIRIKDIKSLRKILIPTIYTLPNLKPVVKPYMPQGPVRDEVKVVREKELKYDIPLQNGKMKYLTPHTVHIIPLDDDYVALATSPILEKHLNEFREEISYITRVAEKADGYLVNDIFNDVKELSDIINTYDFETFI